MDILDMNCAMIKLDTYTCYSCQSKLFVNQLFRSRGDFSEYFCKECYLIDGQIAAEFAYDEQIDNLTNHLYSKQEIADGKKATVDDL